MLYEITDRTNHTELPQNFDEYVMQQTDKLDPILASFPPDTMLRIILDEANRIGDVEVQLRLSLPSQMITSHEAGPPNELRSVFDKALKDLRRQLLEHKDRLSQRKS